LQNLLGKNPEETFLLNLNPLQLIINERISYEFESIGKSASNMFPADIFAKFAGNFPCNKHFYNSEWACLVKLRK